MTSWVDIAYSWKLETKSWQNSCLTKLLLPWSNLQIAKTLHLKLDPSQLKFYPDNSNLTPHSSHLASTSQTWPLTTQTSPSLKWKIAKYNTWTRRKLELTSHISKFTSHISNLKWQNLGFPHQISTLPKLFKISETKWGHKSLHNSQNKLHISHLKLDRKAKWKIAKKRTDRDRNRS